MRSSFALASAAATVAAAAVAVSASACGDSSPRDPGPDLQILGESTRLRLEDPVPASSPWFDGTSVRLVAARGETIGIQVIQRHPAATSLALSGTGLTIRGYEVESFPVVRPSTAMFGGSRGKGHYADGLTLAPSPATNPAYFEISVSPDAPPGPRTGELVVGSRRIPVALDLSAVTLPSLPLRVWAHADPRELAWSADGAASSSSSSAAATAPRPAHTEVSAAERACVAMFRERGILLSPDLQLTGWPPRRELLAGMPYVPAIIPTDPATVGDAVRGWIEATRGTGQIPFSIPIDEPRTPEARRKVRALADAVRAAGGGPGRFLFAVTADPHPDFGDAIDLYIGLRTAHVDGDRVARWTYNGAPPSAGSMVLDTSSPGTRTWGWIGWRWNIPVWYVWNALYWHDRHNRKSSPFPGKPLDPRRDPVSFDDGEDHGNLDGVLAIPTPSGCRPTLRLAALRRGQQDHSLLELASSCAPGETAKLAASLVPRALGDAPKQGSPSWPTDEAAWELARRQLLALAARCATR